MSVLILMYHGVERRGGPLFVDPDTFARHADAIVASRLPVFTISEVANLIQQHQLPERAVALTFDDGFASVVEQATPMLIERGLRATVFCVAGGLNGTNRWTTERPGGPHVQLAGAPDLARLACAGFEIGAHGMSHEPFDTDDAAVIRREVVEARTLLEARVGVRVRSLAYPYGALPSAGALALVRETYIAAVTTRIGRVDDASDPHALSRVDAHYVRSPRLFRAVLDGRANVYLGVRRVAALARRRVRKDYVPRPGQSAES